VIDRWIAFWDRREPATCLVLVRILVGLVVCADLLTAWSLGLVPELWAPPPTGMGFGAIEANPPAVVRWFGATARTAELTWLVATLSAVMLATGTLTRIAAIVCALASAQLAGLSPNADRGIDSLLRIVCVILALSAAGTRFSVDALLARGAGRRPPALVPAWPRYLLFAQTVWVYFSAFHHRSGSGWWPTGSFSALAGILSDPHYTRLAPGLVAPFYPLTQLGTAGTMLFEGSAPLLILWTYFERTRSEPGRLRALANRFKLRWLWLGAGVLLHLGIALTMRLGIFPFGMLALYPCFLYPDEVARGARAGKAWAVRAVNRWRTRAHREASTGPGR